MWVSRLERHTCTHHTPCWKRVWGVCGRDLLMPLSLALWELDGGGSVVLERGISYATGVFLGVFGVWLASLWGAGMCEHLDLAVVCCCCGVGPLTVMWLILGCCAPLTVWCLCGLWLYSSLSPWGPVPSWQERGGLLASVGVLWFHLWGSGQVSVWWGPVALW